MQAPLEIQIAYELDSEGKKVEQVSREVLGANYITLSVNSVCLEENCAALTSSLTAQLELSTAQSSRQLSAKGDGVGLVDAVFDALMKAFSKEHISLNGISIDDFGITSKFRGTDGRKSDAYAIALLRMRNSENHKFTFTYRTPSISGSSLAVMTQAFAFFINSERAFIQLHLAAEDAKNRNRQDLLERFKHQMAVLVHATSYIQVVDRLNEKLKGVAS